MILKYLSGNLASIVGGYLPFCITLCFITMVVVSSTKFVNNMFYLTVLIPGLFLIVRREIPIQNRLLLGVFSYIFYIAISSLWNGGDSLKVFKYFIYLVSFYSAVFYAYKKCDFPNIWFFIMIGGSVIAIEVIGLGSFWLEEGFELWVAKFPRLSAGGLSNPVYLSSILVISGLLVIQQWKSSIQTKLLLLVVVFFCILPFQSRSPLLGLIAGGLALLCIYLERKRDLFIGVCGLLLSLFIYNELSRRGLSFVDSRIFIWELAIETWLQKCSLAFGCGYGYDLDLFVGEREFYHPHSIVLSQLLYGGVVGFTLFVAVFGVFLAKLFLSKSIYFAPVVAALTILLFINNQILNSPNVLWFIFWLPVFLGLIELQEKNKS